MAEDAQRRSQTEQRKKLSHEVPCQLRHFMKKFNLTESTAKEIYARFLAQVKKGLNKHTHPCSDIKCFITYVHGLPNGKEFGKFLALDLGGSNFRVLMVTLSGKSKPPEMDQRTFAVPETIMLGPGVQLFDYVAGCLAEFINDKGLSNERLPLGFTFSFPCSQQGLKVAKLIKWTKGFNCDGVIDQDVGRLLSEAMERKNLKIELIAIVNDTVGTLMSCAYRNPTCRIGLIVGTGSNACYVEKSENCQLLEPELRKKYKETIINCEWGAFGENGDLDFVRTDYDREIDSKTVNIGAQIFEKMISGMYLGELVRLVVLKAVQNKLIFTQCNQQTILGVLNTADVFLTKHLSKCEKDKYPEYRRTEAVIQEIFNIAKPSQEDCYKLLYIVGCIGRRSATLVAIGLSALINKMGNKQTTVGVDGTLYKKHPKYECYICKTMKKLVDKRYRYKMMVSEDGSGLGASIITAVNSLSVKEGDNNCPK